MKPKLRVADARLKIKNNVIDARQTIKKRKIGQHQPVIQQRSTVKQRLTVHQPSKVSDARLKITAKRQKLKSTKVFLQNKSTFSRAIKGALSKTIKNQDAAPKKQVPKLMFDPRKLSSLSGFVSVNNGERVLMEKVTMHRSGMKIAVRNEFAQTSQKNPRKADNTIKITLENPDAKRRQPLSLTRKLTRPATSRGGQSLRSDDLSYEDDKAATIYPSALDRQSPTPSMLGDMPEHYYPLNHSRDFGLRPMKPAVSKTFRSTPVVVQQKSKNEELENHVALPSPLEGTKILVSNLHPVVTEDDILELFSVLGPVRRARLVGPGKAEIVFVRRDDAIIAYQKYNNRDLDGQPMQMKLLLQESRPTNNTKYSWMSEIGETRKNIKTLEIEPSILQRALFKGGSTGTSSHPVVFVVKI